MRSYWLRIFLGALAIFAVGMVGVTLFRRGAAQVHRVVEGDGPITIPLAFIPFALDGERLGTLKRLVIHRDSPREVRAVEVQIDLGDSLVARGLEGCLLRADIEGGPGPHGVHVRAGRDSGAVFSCLRPDSIPADLTEFGEAILQPGGIRVPLYLPDDLVSELQQGLGRDSVAADADSIAAAAMQEAESALAEVPAATAAGRAGRRLGDSLRKAGRARADSIRGEPGRIPDTSRGR